MKIIFSRKGFDSQYGGIPSPIINGKLISLPIPDHAGTFTYDDLGFGNLVTDLSKSRITGDNRCHHDPDLVNGIFGQAGAAQGHLSNQEVGRGDLFLFFGTFQDAIRRKDKFVWVSSTRPKHQFFGWLFIDEIYKNLSGPVASEKVPKKFRLHAHLTGKWPPNNTVYTAPKIAKLFDRKIIRGSGKFDDTPQTTLTHPESELKSFWRIPTWLNPIADGCGLTYHSSKQFTQLGLKTTAKGQEFVACPSQERKFQEWLIDLFSTSSEAE